MATNSDETPDDTDWHAQFLLERERILGALGTLMDGGIVEHLEHVGATSVPGLHGRPYIDIALAVWPFPLDEAAQQTLASLGYALDPDFAAAPEQRFRHAHAPFQLYAAEAGSALWMDYVLVRDYLRHDASARQALAAHKREWAGRTDSHEYRQAKRRWIEPLLGSAHQAWIEREGFSPLRRIADELHDFPAPWHVCGGWALDVFHGQVSRVHQDVDVVISRADQFVLREYMGARGWTLRTPFEERLHPWPPHMRLEPPRHQIHAFRDGAFIDILLADIEGGVWRYRREPTIIRDVSRAWLRAENGIPYLAPELVLLFKSKNTSGRERDKDQTDFQRAYARLEPERRAWLRWALLATEPSHPWIAHL